MAFLETPWKPKTANSDERSTDKEPSERLYNTELAANSGPRRASSALCKPEVAGSIPARSTRFRETSTTQNNPEKIQRSEGRERAENGCSKPKTTRIRRVNDAEVGQAGGHSPVHTRQSEGGD